MPQMPHLWKEQTQFIHSSTPLNIQMHHYHYKSLRKGYHKIHTSLVLRCLPILETKIVGRCASWSQWNIGWCLFCSLHGDMVGGLTVQQRELMNSILKHPCLRKGTDAMVPDQLIKWALLGFIISFLMLLPQAPITIYAQNDFYKAQLRGKNSQGKPSTAVLPKLAEA